MNEKNRNRDIKDRGCRGPAAPFPGDIVETPTGPAGLRDQFAGLAMHAELHTARAHDAPAKALAQAALTAGRTIPEQIAYNAYLVADAMLAERVKAEGGKQ